MAWKMLIRWSWSLFFCFFFSSRRRHTRFSRDWSSDVCSSDLLFLNSLYLLLKASKIIKFQGSWGTDLNPSTKFGKRSFPSPTVNTFLKDPKDLLPRQWGFKKENQVARYRTLLSVSVKKEAEAQHQDHAGQEGRETVYQGGGFGQKPHQDGSHHKSDIARARDKGHPLGGVHPFEVAPDPEHFWDHHGKTQSVQRKARKGHIGDAGKNQYIARQGDQRSKGHQTDGTDLGGNAVPQKASQGHGGGKGQEARADQIFGGQGHLLQIEAAPIDDGPLATHGHKTDNPQKQKGLEQLKTEPFPLHGRGHNMDVMPVEIKIQGQHQKH